MHIQAAEKGKERMGKLFDVIRWCFNLAMPDMKIRWEEEFIDEPCVFVCNHAGAMGPIEMVTQFPLKDRVLCWCNEGIMNRKTCPAYVRQDYWWEPGCRLEPLYNATLPYIAAAVVPPVLKSAPTIPVYHDARVMTTMRKSIRQLKDGNHLVIFPEQPSGFGEHHDWINTGWLNLLVMYHRATGRALRLYPVHIDLKGREFRVAKPICFDPSRTLEEQTEELCRVLANGLRGERVPEDN